MTPWRARLAELMGEYDLPPGADERLAVLLELLRDDATAPTTVRDPARAVDAHVADSLTALGLDAVRCATSIADLGAGAGFPGLPLAVALPTTPVVLLESHARTCGFLERALAATTTVNASVACDRAETWPGRDLDVVTARAVAPLAVLVEYAAPLLRVGGRLVAWKGRADASERRGGDAAAATVGLEPRRPVELAPRPGAEHRALHQYAKVSATPPRFPRRPGMARKRPLSG